MKEDMRSAPDFIRTFPCDKADCCRLSCNPENEAVRNHQRSFGFEEALEMPERPDEIPSVLKLSR